MSGATRGAPDPSCLPISVVGLPRDVVDSLAAAGIVTLGDFASHNPAEIVNIRGVGTGSVRRVRRWLELQGLDEMLVGNGSRLGAAPGKRNVTRPGAPAEAVILPVPESLLNAPVPLHAIPARIANLLRRHGVRTLQELQLALQRNVALEGFGVGTRFEVIESLPRIYAAAAQAGRSMDSLIQRETLGEAVRRLRQMGGRPVPLVRVARELGITEPEAQAIAENISDIVFIDPWCLTTDERGLSDAISVSQPGELGDAILRAIERALSEKEYQVLVRWVGLGRPTLRHGQIALDLERSRERIRQLRQRALMKVSGTPAVSGLLTAMVSTVAGTAPTPWLDTEFLSAFESKFGFLLGPHNTSGFARLCLRGRFGLA